MSPERKSKAIESWRSRWDGRPLTIYLTDEGRALFAKTSVLLAKLDEATAAIASRGDAHEGGCGY